MSAIPRAVAYRLKFPLYDSTTGDLKTGATGFAQRVSKDGGASAASSGAVSEIDAANMPGIYQLVLTTSEMDAQVVAVKITATDALAVSAVITTDPDIYTAKLTLTDDNGGTADRYEIVWFKNGVRVTTGITSPTLQVIKAADGTDLIAATAMTQIGTTGAYRYTATGAERIVSGAQYYAVAQATIDGATRTWAEPRINRDST